MVAFAERSMYPKHAREPAFSEQFITSGGDVIRIFFSRSKNGVMLIRARDEESPEV
jgi:hypothetical protein